MDRLDAACIVIVAPCYCRMVILQAESRTVHTAIECVPSEGRTFDGGAAVVLAHLQLVKGSEHCWDAWSTSVEENSPYHSMVVWNSDVWSWWCRRKRLSLQFCYNIELRSGAPRGALVAQAGRHSLECSLQSGSLHTSRAAGDFDRA